MVQVSTLIRGENQRYHSGTLADMGIKKLISNAGFLFNESEKILKG
jgi:hypothetical protein